MMISIIRLLVSDAGWSSLVARWAHNPKVAGSNPAPATNIKPGNRRNEEGDLRVALFAFRVRDITHKTAKSRQTRDIFERSSGFHAAGKRQFLAPRTRLATPLEVMRLP